MTEIVIISKETIENIQNTQNMILQKLTQKEIKSDEKYISRQNAAKLFDCDTQTIRSLEEEGLINRYGRGKFIRYSLLELKVAMGIK